MSKGTALVTGASGGIGVELARQCAAGGFDVVLVARGVDAMRALAEELERAHGIRASVITADLALPDGPQAVFDAMAGAPVDVLINNAGFGQRGAFSESNWERQRDMIRLNVEAVAHLTRLFLPGMIDRRAGRVLNVASTAAFVPGPFMAVYYAGKAFVRSFSEALANELKGSGVTVTVLCPGPTRTGFGRAAGISDSPLFQGEVMSAADAARIGYDAMMAGRVEVIAGFRNRMMMWSSRFAPRTVLAAVARRLNG